MSDSASMTMTAERFERDYAARSGLTVERLRAFGLYVEVCTCGDPICLGWVMGHPREDAIIEDRARSEK